MFTTSNFLAKYQKYCLKPENLYPFFNSSPVIRHVEKFLSLYLLNDNFSACFTSFDLMYDPVIGNAAGFCYATAFNALRKIQTLKLIFAAVLLRRLHLCEEMEVCCQLKSSNNFYFS